MEKNYIRELRCCYIHAITLYNTECRPTIHVIQNTYIYLQFLSTFMFLKETYLHAGNTMSKEWTHEFNLGLKYI